ncbi:MAG: sulfite exporter TauE/SafE family protein [Kofleriaceae bacterium]|nr:sulfite exporter TauE/SafE family protein [Kofleriaceae bacterium]
MNILALAPILFIAVTVQTTAGFGSVMISLAIGTLFWPVGLLLPIVVCMSMALSAYILLRQWRDVDYPFLLKTILPLMGLGIVAGFLLAPYFSPDKLRVLLGVIVTAAALRGLSQMLSSQSKDAVRNPIVSWLWIAGAGVVHGLLATGGPPLVYALEGARLGKAKFRSTLAAVWLVLNLVHVVRFVRSGAIATSDLPLYASLLPVLVLAVVLGEFCHSRVSERHFRFTVFLLLSLAGMLLLLPFVVNW